MPHTRIDIEMGRIASVPFISTQVVSAIRYPFAKRKLSDFHTGISEKHFQICRQTKSIIVDETKISKKILIFGERRM